MTHLPQRTVIHALILVMGFVLIIGGIISGKHGATVVGIIVASVNMQQWVKWHKQRAEDDHNSR